METLQAASNTREGLALLAPDDPLGTATVRVVTWNAPLRDDDRTAELFRELAVPVLMESHGCHVAIDLTRCKDADVVGEGVLDFLRLLADDCECRLDWHLSAELMAALAASGCTAAFGIGTGA